MKLAKRVIKWLLSAIAVLSLVTLFYGASWLGEVNVLQKVNPRTTAYMALQDAPSNPDHRWTDLDHISPYLICAVVKFEDGPFFQHHGFDWKQIRKALFDRFYGNEARGASTITQQLARNLFLGPDKNLLRKYREAVITLVLESTLSKKRILEIYLNSVEWGERTWGVTEAAQYYFQKSPEELNVTEALFPIAFLVIAILWS